MEKTNTIGQLLSQARTKKDISVEEISNKTKININILRSLEADELDKLPNKTYVRGFVQNYAKVVGLDTKTTLQILNDTYNEKGHEVVQAQNEEIEEEDFNELTPEQLESREKLVKLVHNFFDKKTIISIVGLVVIVFVIKGIISFFSKVNNEQVKIAKVEAQIKPVQDDLFDIKATKKLQEISQAKIEPAKEETKEQIASQQTKVVELNEENSEEVKEETKEEVKLPKGKLPFVKFYPAPKNMYEVLPNAEENFDEKLIPLNIRESVIADKENVFIHAIDGDSWISYKTDDDKIKRFVLKQGRHIIIRGDTILLFMGNATVSKIYYNNQLVKFKTSSGVKSLIFPKEKIQNFELPLFPSFEGVPFTANEYKERMIDE